MMNSCLFIALVICSTSLFGGEPSEKSEINDLLSNHDEKSPFLDLGDEPMPVVKRPVKVSDEFDRNELDVAESYRGYHQAAPSKNAHKESDELPTSGREKSPFLEADEIKLPTKKHKGHQGQSLSGDFDSIDSYVEYTYRGLHKEHQDDGDYLFAFEYIKDSYNYKDNNGRYKKIFVDSTGSQNPGMILFSSAYYFNRRFIDFALGMNFGVGYQYGYGTYTGSDELSTTKFQLWSFPLDLALHAEMPVTSWLKVGASAGPSFLLLYQDRNDREQGEEGKRVKHYGYGYFATVNFKISLSNLFPKTAFDYYRSYDVTKTYFDLGARTVSYSNFQQKDLEISGTSIMAGFSFEYF